MGGKEEGRKRERGEREEGRTGGQEMNEYAC
jgi:hypothetical protein